MICGCNDNVEKDINAKIGIFGIEVDGLISLRPLYGAVEGENKQFLNDEL